MVAHTTTAPAVAGTEAEARAAAPSPAATPPPTPRAARLQRDAARPTAARWRTATTPRNMASSPPPSPAAPPAPATPAPCTRANRSHTTLASSAMHRVPRSGDLKAVHGGAASCTTCHGNPSYPSAADRQARVRELPQRRRRGHQDYTPGRPEPLRRHRGEPHGIGPDRYRLTVFACSTCHSLEMKPEHFKSSTATPTLRRATPTSASAATRPRPTRWAPTRPGTRRVTRATPPSTPARHRHAQLHRPATPVVPGADCHNTANAYRDPLIRAAGCRRLHELPRRATPRLPPSACAPTATPRARSIRPRPPRTRRPMTASPATPPRPTSPPDTPTARRATPIRA